MTLLPGVGALREFSAHAGVHCFLWARAAPCAFVQQPAASPTVGTGVPWGAATHSWHRASTPWRDDLLSLHTRAHLEAAQSCDVGVRCSHAEEPPTARKDSFHSRGRLGSSVACCCLRPREVYNGFNCPQGCWGTCSKTATNVCDHNVKSFISQGTHTHTPHIP